MPVKINWPAVGLTLLPNVGGITGGFAVRNSMIWYEKLNKPTWNPPNYVFAPMWTSLYCGIGYASYLVYRDAGGLQGEAKIPLIIYGSNLLLNWAWTPIFFGLQKPNLALCELQLINATAIATGYFFYKINPLAGYLFIPYCLWLGVATALNYSILKRNSGSADIKEIKRE